MSTPSTALRRPRARLIVAVAAVLVVGGFGASRLAPRVASLFAPTCAESASGAPATGAPAAPKGSAPLDSAPQGSAAPGATLPPMPSLPAGPPAGNAVLRVPILMYHEVRADADPSLGDYQMTPARFTAQICTLAQRGWRSITAAELASLLATGGTPPARTMVITFDDGTIDHGLTVFPVLRQYGFPSTFFVVSGFTGTAGYLNWDQLRAMRAAGMEIGSHSAHHPRLSDVPAAQAAADVAEAQRVIAAHLGASPVTFAYPGGAVNDSAVAAVREVGILAAFTTAEGRSYGWAERLVIPRINVGAGWDAAKLASIVEGYGR